MPTIKEFESLLDSKLQPIQAKSDGLVKQMNDNYTARQTKLDLLEARNVSLVAENATLANRLNLVKPVQTIWSNISAENALKFLVYPR